MSNCMRLMQELRQGDCPGQDGHARLFGEEREGSDLHYQGDWKQGRGSSASHPHPELLRPHPDSY